MARAMAREEVAANFEERFANVISGEIVSAEGSGDNASRIKFADALAKAFELVGGNEAAVADVAFVGEVEIPIAMIFETCAESFNRPQM